MKHFHKVHKNTEGNHEPIYIENIIHNKKFFFIINNLNSLKFQVISTSRQLIHTIQLITAEKLAFIQKNIDACEQVSKNREVETERKFKPYENLKIQEPDKNSFLSIVNKCFSIYKDEKDVENISPKNIIEEKKVELSFEFMEEHSDFVRSLAVTSDNKYIISGSADKTIRL